jgi:hypothetical protein
LNVPSLRGLLLSLGLDCFEINLNLTSDGVPLILIFSKSYFGQHWSKTFYYSGLRPGFGNHPKGIAQYSRHRRGRPQAFRTSGGSAAAG